MTHDFTILRDVRPVTGQFVVVANGAHVPIAGIETAAFDMEAQLAHGKNRASVRRRGMAPGPHRQAAETATNGDINRGQAASLAAGTPGRKFHRNAGNHVDAQDGVVRTPGP